MHLQREKNKFIDQGKPSQALLDLCKLTHVPVKPTDSLDVIVKKTQKAWYQGKKERWEARLPESLNNPDIIDKIIHICYERLDLHDAILPPGDTLCAYDGVFFLGASYHSVINRLDFYLDLVKSGKISKDLPLWVLTGERALTPRIGETEEVFRAIVNPRKKTLPLPTNEAEMIAFVFHHRLPEDIKATLIDSQKERGYGRATTQSTIEAFIHTTGIKSGRFLAISNQPYVYYQQTALQSKLLQLGIPIEITCVGGAAKNQTEGYKNTHAAMLLDNVAKVLFNLRGMKP